MELLAGFVFGFLGSVHCIGMCGPIVLALPVGTEGVARYVGGRLLYNVGRMFTYAVLGGIVGLIGAGLSLTLIQQNLSVVAGAAILIGVLYRRFSSVIPFSRHHFGSLSQAVQRGMSTLLKGNSLPPMFFLGALTGLLPCGFVYLAITTAAVTADIGRGMIFMAGFGLGTTPALAAFSLFPRFISTTLRVRISRFLPALTILVAVLLILRGLDLGIPFVSPRMSGPHSPEMMQHHH